MNAEGKYTWQKVEANKSYVWHTEGDTKTLIAITDTAEKAHFLATASNQYNSPQPEGVPASEVWISKDRNWSKYPVGTKAKAIMGGYWIKTERGWQWPGGSTFPQPGGDASGDVCLPQPKEGVPALPDEWGFTYFPNHGDEGGRGCYTIFYARKNEDGDYDFDGDEILVAVDDKEEDAIEACKRLNSILQKQALQQEAKALQQSAEVDPWLQTR